VLAVVKGVEKDGHLIVAQNIVALGHARAEHRFLFFTEEDGVEIIVVVGEIGDGFARYLRAVRGGVLAEIVDAGLAGRNFAVDEIVQNGGLGNAGQMNGLDLLREVGGLRGGGNGEGEQQRGSFYWRRTSIPDVR